MRCLLTGCNGFIAKNLIKYIKNFEITGLDIRESELVPTLVQDVSTPISGEFELVIHAASGFTNDIEMFNANFLGTKRCIEVATRNNCPLVYISSAEAYEPVRTYGIMKLAGEYLVKTYLNGFIIRPFHIYGPLMNLNDGRIQSEILKSLRYDTVLKMRGDGSAIRTFTHVNDLITAIELIILKGKQGIIYDVSNESEAISIEQLCKKLKIKYELGSEKHPIKENVGNSWRLRELGWSTSINTLDGFLSASRNGLE
jgi:nucleoside-diphosphate-sugar epimerase